MTEEKRMRILTNALGTILAEAKEPIIKVYAQSALDETKDIPVPKIHNIRCDKHKWYGLPNEICPECNPIPPATIQQEGEVKEDYKNKYLELEKQMNDIVTAFNTTYELKDKQLQAKDEEVKKLVEALEVAYNIISPKHLIINPDLTLIEAALQPYMKSK